MFIDRLKQVAQGGHNDGTRKMLGEGTLFGHLARTIPYDMVVKSVASYERSAIAIAKLAGHTKEGLPGLATVTTTESPGQGI